MAAFLVAEDSPGTSEFRWLDAFGRRMLPSLRLPTSGRVVVVSAHPDDDVLAVGSLLAALHGTGLPINSVVATNGEGSHVRSPPLRHGSRRHGSLGHTRRHELQEAYEQLGIEPSVTWLGVPDGEVSVHEEWLSHCLLQMLSSDTVLLAPWRFDGHPDHDAVGRAAARAAFHSGAELWEFPVWVWHWAEPSDGAFPWDRAHSWPCGDVIRKGLAIECFETQIRDDDSRVGGPVLPAAVLDRFRRPFEVVFT